MQHTLFTAPVLVKPLGIVLTPDAFFGPATLSVNIKRHYSLVTPTESTNELYVKSEVQAFFNVSVVLIREHLKLLEGASALNEFMEKQLREEMRAAQAVAAEPVKGRRRRKVVDEDAEEENEDVAETKHETALVAKTFSALLVKFDEPMVSLVDSQPYKAMVSVSDKNEDRLENEIAKINKYVRYISDARNKLRAPDPTIDDALSSFVPNLDNDLESLERKGLDSYEDTLKTKLAEVENRLRESYKFFEDSVVASYNKKAKTVIKPFTGEYTLNDSTTSLDEFLAAIREEVFVPIKF